VAACQKGDPGISALTNMMEVFGDQALLIQAAFGFVAGLDIRKRL
jgi:hypothetical protein